jgi:penicillin amidase
VKTSRWKRVAAFLLGSVVLATLAAGAAVLWYLRSVRPVADGAVELAGLGGPVEVWRDSLGVPHVWARGAEDLLFAQGYVHAQDRLWQLELFRRVAEGRLSEVMGEQLVETDRLLRTIGLWRAAIAQESALSAESRQLLEAYAAGINAFLRTRTSALPPELVALEIDPEPWTVRHSLAIEKIMAWDLSLYGGAAALLRVAPQLDSTRLRWFGEAYPPWGPTIIEAELPELPEAAAALLEAASITRASNAWVIGGSRTISGKPILANDMHLALRAPSLWYLMALHGGGFDVAGMTLPGVPFVIAGHNRAIAWGFTNAMVDDVDFFAERVDPSDSARYITPTGSEPFAVHAETLHVKGQSAPVVFTVRSTRHGPVMTDGVWRRGGEPIAMRWAAHEPSRSLEGIPH